ncbi:MAG: hypothetical protein ACTTIS_04680 [Streptobacillus sp.]
MSIKKGSKRTWDIWKNKKTSELRVVNVGLRLNKDEHRRLQEAKAKTQYTTAQILLIGISQIEKNEVKL